MADRCCNQCGGLADTWDARGVRWCWPCLNTARAEAAEPSTSDETRAVDSQRSTLLRDLCPPGAATGMRCPDCGSTDVECHENTRRHVHLCNGCGRKDIYREGNS